MKSNSVLLVAGGVLSGWGFGSGNKWLWISGIITVILGFIFKEK